VVFISWNCVASVGAVDQADCLPGVLNSLGYPCAGRLSSGSYGLNWDPGAGCDHPGGFARLWTWYQSSSAICDAIDWLVSWLLVCSCK
jgi:hypothetical protein